MSLTRFQRVITHHLAGGDTLGGFYPGRGGALRIAAVASKNHASASVNPTRIVKGEGGLEP
jgi:hypothetical protein